MAVVSNHTALLSGFSWNAGWGARAQGTPVFLTYSFGIGPLTLNFPTDDPTYFRSLFDAEKNLFRQALHAWESVSGVTFLEAAPGAGDLEVGAYDLAGREAGRGGYPAMGFHWQDGAATLYAAGDTTWGGKVYLDHAVGMTMQVMLHEIGHALGLKHPHDDAPLLASSLDNSHNTIMSYTGIGESLGPLDVAAIQALYGGSDSDGKQVASWSWDSSTNQLSQAGSAADEIIVGTAANDVIFGNGGNDLIVTRAGKDVITVNGMRFQVNAGEGLDTLQVDFTSSLVERFVLHGEHRYILTHGRSSAEDMKAFAVERIVFADATVAFDTDGAAGQSYRLYQAAFARVPDTPGLSYWVNLMDGGMTLHRVAQHFLDSTEFGVTYGQSTTDQQLITLLYMNVLGRDGEPAGKDYWRGQLDTGAIDRAQVLYGFSESNENQANVAPVIDQGIWLV